MLPHAPSTAYRSSSKWILRLVDKAMRTEDWASSDQVLLTGHGSLPDEDWQASRPATFGDDQDDFDPDRIE